MSFERGEAAGYDRGKMAGLKQGEAAGRVAGRLEASRSAIRRVFTRRKLSLSAEMSARLDACADLAVLERWVEEAAVAKTVEEALK